ncbi:TonB-dependent receptor [Komagataeibacter sp. FXV3]|uniref:TonB-dependent receptor n=1 Tax=Komagataeibacter sp. FXV3 TaxID=2608998 RepID=UPI001D1045C7|nr:TonB-dependent receptor [Komagataeibacter sp. FXV3]
MRSLSDKSLALHRDWILFRIPVLIREDRILVDRLFSSSVALFMLGWSSTLLAQTTENQNNPTTSSHSAKKNTNSVNKIKNTSDDTAASNARTEEIMVKAQRRLLREKNSPSAVTELGADHIRQAGLMGSIATILRDAPSVNVYQSGIGNNEPVMSVRGARGLEVAQTLDGVPMQDLLNGGSGAYMNSLIGGKFNMDQISGVSIYPGVAYPSETTFGTIGGTIAYHTLRPSNDRHLDVTGSVGSFGTWNEGFEASSGRLNGWMGRGIDAPKIMLKYSNMQTQNYIEYTPARYNNMEFAFDKPYDDGQSLFQATILYNTGNGRFEAQPVPTAWMNKYGKYSNYNPDTTFGQQNNDYFTMILKDDTYVNDYLNVGVTGFYEFSDSTTLDYQNPDSFSLNGAPTPYSIGGSNIFTQTPAGFGEQGYYGYGNPFYMPGVYTYGGSSANCPAGVSSAWSAAGQTSPCGYNAQLSYTRTDTYGIRPRLTITPPRFWGIENTIKVGALIAKETSNLTPTWAGGTPNVAETNANLISGGGKGGGQRVMYQGYFQDKIDMFKNTLHVTPGFVIEGTQSGLTSTAMYGGQVSAAAAATTYCKTYGCNTGFYSAKKWDREWLPFINVSYDLDKVVPALKGLSFYGSWGNSALYAPVSDFTPNVLGQVPNASIVHMEEGGIKYNVSNLSISVDYFHQKIDRDFGMFEFQSGSLAGYSEYTNAGQRTMKGEEASVIWQVTPQIQLFGNFSHLSAYYDATALESMTVQQDQFGIATKGSPVTGIPSWLSTIGIDYRKRSLFRPSDDFNVRFQGQYTGHQNTTYDLTGFQNIGNIPGVGGFNGGTNYNYYTTTAGATTYDPHGGIAPYMIFSLDLNYNLPLKGAGPLKSLNFDVNVYNLFNTFYMQYKYKQIAPGTCSTISSGPLAGQPASNYGCGTSFSNGIAGQPASVTFTIRARFG